MAIEQVPMGGPAADGNDLPAEAFKSPSIAFPVAWRVVVGQNFVVWDPK